MGDTVYLISVVLLEGASSLEAAIHTLMDAGCRTLPAIAR
jgi:hypothetical protein